MTRAIETHTVDPARLMLGIPEAPVSPRPDGDIVASYSADRIGLAGRIRRPFEWRGDLWVCVSISTRHCRASAEAYRLTSPEAFEGTPMTYPEKTADAEAARSDPHGFYHGMSVQSGSQTFVLTGPPVMFAPGRTAQLDLFQAADSHARTRG